MSRERAHAAWKSAEMIKTVSDRVVGIGPFGVGMDGLLSFVPVAGTVYSVLSSGFLLVEAARAQVSMATLMRMLLYLGVDSSSSLIPVAGSAVDFFWQGQLMAATALQKDVEDRHGAPDGVPQKRWTRKRPRKMAGAH